MMLVELVLLIFQAHHWQDYSCYTLVYLCVYYNFRSLHALFNLQRCCLFPKHLFSPLLTHSVLAVRPWNADERKCTRVTITNSFCGVSSRSCLSAHQTFYSPLKCHKATLSLIIPFSLKYPTIFQFLPLILSANIASYVPNWIWLKTVRVLHLQLNILSCFHLGSLEKSPLGCELLDGSHHDFFHSCIFDAQLIFFNGKAVSKYTQVYPLWK